MSLIEGDNIQVVPLPKDIGFDNIPFQFKPTLLLQTQYTFSNEQQNIKYINMNLCSLGHEKYKLKRDIPIVIEIWGIEDFVACQYETQNYGHGINIQDAIDKLQDNIIWLYEDLKNEEKENMSEELFKAITTLKEFIIETPTI